MKTKTIVGILILIFLAGIGTIAIAKSPFGRFNQKQNNERLNQTLGKSQNKANCVAEECLLVDGLDYPAGELSAEAKKALVEAIEDEYKAHAFYEKVIGKFGNLRPFIMIIRAEEQHISQLKAIFDKYGLVYPESEWEKQLTAPNSFQSACQAGVEAEISNAKLYQEKLLPAVKDYEDITVVFTNLMNASEQKHLPAFEKCN